jgi:hypothetical protein
MPYLKEFHCEVDTIRIAPRDFEVPRPCGTGRDYQRVVLSADFLGVDINSDMSAVDECLQTRQKMDLKKKRRDKQH